MKIGRLGEWRKGAKEGRAGRRIAASSAESFTSRHTQNCNWALQVMYVLPVSIKEAL